MPETGTTPNTGLGEGSPGLEKVLCVCVVFIGLVGGEEVLGFRCFGVPCRISVLC